MNAKEQLPDGAVAVRQLEDILSGQIKIEDTNISPDVVIENSLALVDIPNRPINSNSGHSPTNSSEPYQLTNQYVQRSVESRSNHTPTNGFMPASGSESGVPLSEHSVEREHLKRVISDQLDLVKKEITNSVLSIMDALLAKTVAALKSNYQLPKPNPVYPVYQPKVTSKDELHLFDMPGVSGSNFNFTPVKSAKELEILEQNLNDPFFARKMFDQMREKIGYKGDNYCGQNTCYTLIDNFFDRKFLVQCSWSGGSRSDIEKCAIKDCKNTLMMFYKIVRSTNKKFTLMLLEDFFKSVVRNAKRRSEAKGLRASTIHRRMKKKSNPADRRSRSEASQSTATRTTDDLQEEQDQTMDNSTTSEVENESYKADDENAAETSSKRLKLCISSSPTDKITEN
ncbi:uncharacterized protein LOC129729611 isoform X2 [Wyeomyia smithii]|nr:uncharacterized protein LOC129729611 isoform X2 [Wyeomyia smithii]